MQENKTNRLSIVIISLTILISSLWIGYSIQQINIIDSSNQSKSLITQEEAAYYLSLTPETFEDLIFKDLMERSKYTSYDTYAFLPYVIVNEKKYFNLELLDLWVEYNSLNHTSFKTN